MDDAAAPAKRNSFQEVLKIAFEFYNAGRQTEAEAMCRVLIQINPRDSQLLLLLGMLLQKTGRSREALTHLNQAATLQPQSARIFNSLGFVYQSLKDHPRAVENYTRAIELGAQTQETFYNLGNSCFQLDDLERAVSHFRKAVELNPQDAASWNNLGKCLKELNRMDESIAAYDRAIAIAPDYFLALYGRAISLLTAGRLGEGLQEYNRWRGYRIAQRQFTQPGWQGETAQDKTLFLHAEQGFGDAIQAVRFVRTARERVGKVILECRPELKTLFAHSNGADVVLAYGEPIPPFDYFTSLLSLPGILGVTLEKIPNQTPYLRANPCGALPAAPAGHLKVGLAWAGNPSHHNDAARSIPLREFAPLFQVQQVAFYSLQAQIPERDAACFQSITGLADVRGKLTDFLATASVIQEMDLVVAVDTAVAHLAGALAKPVWTLIQHSPDWRWFLNRADTPWYPTMRLFRQPRRGQWPPVISQAAGELRGLAKDPAKIF